MDSLASKKKIYTFAHIPKNAGSSIWHALASCAKNINSIYVDDAFERYKQNNKKISDLECLLKLTKNRFIKNKSVNTLLIHLHKDFYNLDRLLPDNLEKIYIVPIRNPNDRLRSAWRHYNQQKDKNDSISFTDHMLFKNGLELVVPAIFGLKPSSRLSSNHIEQLRFISLEDYNNKSLNIINLIKEIGLDENIPIHTLLQTVTKKNIPQPTDIFTIDAIENKIKIELDYYHYIQSLRNNT